LLLREFLALSFAVFLDFRWYWVLFAFVDETALAVFTAVRLE
jgi:hypothetical protein